MKFTPKQRMLNAYRGVFSDRYPVAPEFWYYYPAKVLGVDMIEFEREIALWEALQKTFVKFGTEGWGVAAAVPRLSQVSTQTSFDKIEEGRYGLTVNMKYNGREFISKRIYDKFEPSWATEYSVKDESDIKTYFDMLFQPETEYDFKTANDAYEKVGEDYLLEMCLCGPFLDVICAAMGFEKSIIYFMTADRRELETLQRIYLDSQIEFIKKACEKTRFESFFLGCSYSCNSFIGPVMWRQWDK